MTDKKTEIINWLQGPRDYDEGVKLYDKYGINLMLKQRFRYDRKPMVVAMLPEELRKIAGLSVDELVQLPRHNNGGADVDTPAPVENVPVTPKRATPNQVQTIRIRERFPFLADPGCPDVLKVLVADMITDFGRYKDCHARLVAMPDELTPETAALCESIVESYLNNHDIWRELEHYQKTGEILGRAAKFAEIKVEEDLASLSDVDLMKKLGAVRANVSKAKKAVDVRTKKGAPVDDALAKLESWTAKKIAVEEEVERRKKKSSTD